VALTETHNPCLSAVADRHPLLLQDISDWVRRHPESARLSGVPANPVLLRRDGHDLLIDLMPPEQVLDRLDSEPNRRLVHIFPHVAGCLHFLGQPGAQACVERENWHPLLLIPLPSATHTQSWLSKTHPGDWPWQLLKPDCFEDSAVALEAQSLGRQMLQMLAQMCSALNDALEPRYGNRPTPGQVLHAAERPLRVLVFAGQGSSYQQFCARDITEALIAHGVEAQTHIASPGAAFSYELLLAIREFDPDVLFLNGRSRNPLHVLPRNLAVVAWDQDYAISCSPAYASHAGPRDLLLVMVADWLDHARAFGVPPQRLAHLNLGTNTRLYHPPAPPPAPVEPEFDILFVGNIYPFEAYKRLIHFDQLNVPTQQLMVYARQRLIDWVRSQKDTEPWVIPDCQSFLTECLRELGVGLAEDPIHWQFLVHYFRYRIAHLALRELYVSALAEFKLGLFGRGWDQIPAVAAQARPEIANGPALCDAIYRSRINLHLHTWTVHHPRLYDTAAAGGFLLVGRVQEQYPLEKVFTPGQELETFGSIAELKHKIRHYLDRPVERAEMACRAARRAEQQHTMQQRMGQVIELLRKDTDGSD
jgi:glycosyltransferase involved in cell wall biosynthesis